MISRRIRGMHRPCRGTHLHLSPAHRFGSWLLTCLQGSCCSPTDRRLVYETGPYGFWGEKIDKRIVFVTVALTTQASKITLLEHLLEHSLLLTWWLWQTGSLSTPQGQEIWSCLGEASPSPCGTSQQLPRRREEPSTIISLDRFS